MKSQKILLIALVAIIALATWTRLYAIEGTMTFQGDQGRDALIVSRMFLEGRPVLIGPVTSVGNLYLGPFYYYFMMPFLWMSYPNPVGPAVAVAIIGIATVFATYWWGKQMFGTGSALLAALGVASSNALISFSRFSWNPNITPFFALTMVYCTWRALGRTKSAEKKLQSDGAPIWWLGVAGSFSILIQLHYMTLILLGGAGLLWIIALMRNPKSKQFWLYSALSALLVIFSFAPILLFDLRHNGSLTDSFERIFVQEKVLVDITAQTSDSSNIVSNFAHRTAAIVRESHGRSEELFLNNFIGKNKVTSILSLTILFGAAAISTYRFFTGSKKNDADFVLVAYLLSVLIGISAYTHSLFLHYIIFAFPLVLLFVSRILTTLIPYKIGWVLLITWMYLFARYNYQPGYYAPFPRSQQDMASIADAIAERLQTTDTPYDILLLSESGDVWGFNYRYWLSTTSAKPIPAESNQPIITLVIINEEKIDQDLDQLEQYHLQTFPSSRTEERFITDDDLEVIIWRKIEL